MEKEKNSIDNFFRETLRDHEILPSERAKEAFLKEAQGIPLRKETFKRIFPYIILAVLITAGIYTFFYSVRSEDNNRQSLVSSRQSAVGSPQTVITHQPSAESIQKSNNDQQKSLGSKSIERSTSPSTTSSPDKKKITKVKNTSPSKPIKKTSVGETIDKTTFIPKNSNSIALNNEKSKPVTVVPEILSTNGQGVNTIQTSNGPASNAQSANPPPHPGTAVTPVGSGINSDTASIVKDKLPDSVSSNPGAVPDNGKKTKMNREWFLSMAAQYSPEYMFNTLEDSKFINNFGVEGMFIFGNYSVRTGICFSIGKGTNELAVEYNDFLGSYQKLDSMSFAWDGSIQNYIPSFYMSNQEVWDSLMKVDSLKVVKRYTYLQIPLVLGYDFIHSGRFSLGFRAGPLLSILINSKQLSAEYDPGKKKIIQVNSVTPGQVDLNWQVMAGINATLRISRRFLFELEPMAKYYFNSVYEKADITKKPWSLGIRAAFTVKIN
jgi:hypothetical protein